MGSVISQTVRCITSPCRDDPPLEHVVSSPVTIITYSPEELETKDLLAKKALLEKELAKRKLKEEISVLEKELSPSSPKESGDEQNCNDELVISS